MDSETGNGTLPQRNALETPFFDQGVWQELSHAILGIDQLRNRLSKVLLRHITSELPSLVEEIESKHISCDNNKFKKLGRPRVSRYDQQLYLIGIAESFQRLVESAAEGNWNDLFFKNGVSEHGYQRRIRAVIQNLIDNFAKTLLESGDRRHVITSNTALPEVTMSINRDDFIKHIQLKMKRSRGRELPGLFDPMIVADLFREQASPWEQLARNHIETSWKACKLFLKHVITHIADPGTSTALTQKIIGPAMDKIFEALKSKIGDVLRSHQQIHPITYNHYFTETIQKVRAGRRRDECAAAVMRFFGVSTLAEYSIETVDLSSLVDTVLRGAVEPDMSRFAASEALDHMDAYYKVAMKRFIDDVAVEVIEVVLVSALANILSPVEVYKMNPDLVASIAGESEETRNYREQLTRQLEVLGKGAGICKHFVDVRLSDDDEETEEQTNDSSSHKTCASEDNSPHSDETASQTPEMIECEESLEKVSLAEPICEPLPEKIDLEDEWASLTTSKKKKKKAKNSFSWD